MTFLNLSFFCLLLLTWCRTKPGRWDRNYDSVPYLSIPCSNICSCSLWTWALLARVNFCTYGAVKKQQRGSTGGAASRCLVSGMRGTVKGSTEREHPVQIQGRCLCAIAPVHSSLVALGFVALSRSADLFLGNLVRKMKNVFGPLKNVTFFFHSSSFRVSLQSWWPCFVLFRVKKKLP